MFAKLSAHTTESFCSVAVDFKPIFGSKLLDAFEIANKHGFDQVGGAATGVQLHCFSRKPRWNLFLLPQRIQASFLPITDVLEDNWRREISNLVHRLLSTMGVDIATRVGVQITTFIPQVGRDFKAFSQEFADHVIRSPIAAVLGICEVDPLIKLTGKDSIAGISISTTLASMTREDALTTLNGSAVKILERYDTRGDDVFRSFSDRIGDTNLFFDADTGSKDVLISKFRTTFDNQLKNLNSQLDSALKFLATEK